MKLVVVRLTTFNAILQTGIWHHSVRQVKRNMQIRTRTCSSIVPHSPSASAFLFRNSSANANAASSYISGNRLARLRVRGPCTILEWYGSAKIDGPRVYWPSSICVKKTTRTWAQHTGYFRKNRLRKQRRAQRHGSPVRSLYPQSC